MSITEKEIKEYEDREKKELYTALEELIYGEIKFIDSVQVAGQFLNFDTNIPNIGITANNKLVELSHEFEEAGISMFSEVYEEDEYIDSNIVGDAIINDIYQQVGIALKELKKYKEKSGDLAEKKAYAIQDFLDAGPIKKFFWKIKMLFRPEEEIIESLMIAPQEVQDINLHLAKYRELDDKLFNYNLKENVSNSIIKHIKQLDCDEESIQMLLEEEVAPNLNKLGFGNLIPEIEKEFQAEIEKAYMKNKKSWEMANWEIDEEEFRKVTADICFENSKKQTKNNTTKGLSERE